MTIKTTCDRCGEAIPRVAATVAYVGYTLGKPDRSRQIAVVLCVHCARELLAEIRRLPWATFAGPRAVER